MSPKTRTTNAAKANAARAARRIMTDDGFNIGVLYAGDRAPYPLNGRSPQLTPEQLAAEFQT